ncbi:hypothetical protein MPSEU_000594500 [Mayamaea pseudoterrestris]|nr:hypothetical protein MPSEU_000594500 [Mayamaea pseudoterrestris]
MSEMEASIDSNSKRRDNIEAANPFRRLAFLARHGRQPKFSDYLHAMSEYKSMHGHLRVKRHEDSRLYEYILELRSDLMQRASLPLSVNRIQRIQILKQLGLAAEIVSFHGKRKQPMRQRSNLESLPEQRWSDEFMHFVVEPTLEDYVPTFESQASRLQWLHQQQVEYFAVKAKSDDPYTNILANFRYILLNSAEEEAKAEGCKSSAD